MMTIFGVIGYLIIMGMFYQVFIFVSKKRCGDQSYDCEYCSHDIWGAISSAVWPLSIPVVAGIGIGVYITGIEDRKKAAHKRKVAELAAKRELNETALKLLEAEGWKARVTE